MLHLCSIDSTQLSVVFGRNDPIAPIPPKYENIQMIMIGQKPDCSGYLFLTDTLAEEFTKHTSVPEGYDFIFRQEWGLTINESIIHRVIATLRAEAYPPLAEYVDAMVKGDEAQLQKYTEACLAVKARYPKFSW